jgi:hypothetical protein
MRNILKIIPFFIAFLPALFTLSSAAQFKVTRVYDGDIVQAEGCGFGMTLGTLLTPVT